MREERAVFLKELLEEMMENDGLQIPDAVWWTFMKIAGLPYNELIVPRRRGNEWAFLLVRRQPDDPEWLGGPWAIPGSLWRPWRWSEPLPGVSRRRVPVSQAEACAVAAKKEFGVPVDFFGEAGTHFWNDFGYRYPISHLAICFEREDQPVVELESRRFFRPDEPPEPIVRHAQRFLEKAALWLDEICPNLP